MSRVECSICVRKVAATNIVGCPACDHTSCKSCMETYILGIDEEPKCMSCNVKWTDEYKEQISTKFFNGRTYKAHRCNILFNREVALMAETQPYVEQEIKRYEVKTQINELKKQKKDIQNTINELERQMNEPNFGMDTNISFDRKCPTEGCNGFMKCEEQKMHCSICTKCYCKECNEEITDSSHVCDETIKNDYQAIVKDSTPCPSCGVRIHKIDGCDQMWCTQCHTAFSYRTGEIDLSGHYHNPHYNQWMNQNARNRAREVGDYVCGGMPAYNSIYGTLREVYPDNPELIKLFQDHNYIGVFGKTRSLFDNKMRWAQQDNRRFDPNRFNRIWRIKYMRKQISERIFKKRLIDSEKCYQRQRANLSCIDFWMNATVDIMLDYVNYRGWNPEKNLWRTMTSLYNLRSKYNLEMRKINDLYNKDRNFNSNYIASNWEMIGYSYPSILENGKLKRGEFNFETKEYCIKNLDEYKTILNNEKDVQNRCNRIMISSI